jgi:hypothetical protein
MVLLEHNLHPERALLQSPGLAIGNPRSKTTSSGGLAQNIGYRLLLKVGGWGNPKEGAKIYGGGDLELFRAVWSEISDDIPNQGSVLVHYSRWLRMLEARYRISYCL